MISPRDWRKFSRAIHMPTTSGPCYPATAAAATVARLRRASKWSHDFLAYLSGFEDASTRVANSRVLIVDRKGAAAISSPVFTGGTDPVPSLGMCQELNERIALRMWAQRALGFWDCRKEIRVFIAPNVLNLAEHYGLDQTDYCRWLALRVGLWAVCCEESTWLAAYFGAIDAKARDYVKESISITSLINATIEWLMRSLTPSDIASINWIRRQLPPLISGNSFHASREDISVRTIHKNERDVYESFVDFIAPKGGIPVFLHHEKNIPSFSELTDPAQWVNRVIH